MRRGCLQPEALATLLTLTSTFLLLGALLILTCLALLLALLAPLLELALHAVFVLLMSEQVNKTTSTLRKCAHSHLALLLGLEAALLALLLALPPRLFLLPFLFVLTRLRSNISTFVGLSMCV